MKEGEILLGLTIEDLKETLYIALAMACISFSGAFVRKVLLNYIKE